MIRCVKRGAMVHVSVVHARRWPVYRQKQMKGSVSFPGRAWSGDKMSKRKPANKQWHRTGPWGCCTHCPLWGSPLNHLLKLNSVARPGARGVSRLESIPGAGITRRWWSRAGASSRQQGKSICCGCAGLAFAQRSAIAHGSREGT